MNNILNLNDDCLMKIFEYLCLIDLCSTAETCRRFQSLAREVFKYKRRSYGMPGQREEKLNFEDHERILKNFGDIITKFTFFVGFGINGLQTKIAFEWMDRYAGNKLQEIVIVAAEKVSLPKSTANVMAKVKSIEIMAPITERNLRKTLLNCTNLVRLRLTVYDGPFHFQEHRFPHLLSLCNRVRVGPRTDYNLIETFFQHHTKLTELNTQFLNDLGPDGVVDLSFLKHLTNLTHLDLVVSKSLVVGIEAFAHLKNLKELSIDSSSDKRTDVMILETLASIDSLVKLQLGLPDLSHLIASIGRFKNLSTLAISEYSLSVVEQFGHATIASLANLSNSPCTELYVKCITLLKPESIVAVIHNMRKVKKISLFCEVNLSEEICRKLAKICSAQRRKIEVILDKEIIDDFENVDYDFVERFNRECGALVEIKVVCVKEC